MLQLTGENGVNIHIFMQAKLFVCEQDDPSFIIHHVCTVVLFPKFQLGSRDNAMQVREPIIEHKEWLAGMNG